MVDLRRGVEFDDLALEHDGDAVADLEEQRKVVGDEDDGESELLAQFGDLLEDLPLDQNVERGCRLVHDHELWAKGEGHGDHDALAHAAGEFVGVGAQPLPTDLHQVEQPRAFLTAFLPRHVGPVRQKDVVELAADRGDGVEGVHCALEYHRDLVPAERAEALWVERVDVDVLAGLVVEDDLAGRDHRGRSKKSLDAVGQRGLATAGLPGQAHNLATLERERNVAHCLDGRIDLVHDADVLQCQ